jgi:hypothetical protein
MDECVYLVWHDDGYPEDTYLISIHSTRAKALQAIAEDRIVKYKIECWTIDEKGVR